MTADAGEPVKLKRHLGVLQGIGIICGLIIGSGIYVSPKGVLIQTDSVGLSLILWLLGGLLGGLGAVCFTELGTTFPASGEKYAYLEKMFGPFVAFLYLWMYVLMFRPGANAVKMLTFASYILKPAYPDCDIPPSALILMAVAMASLLSAVNCVNVTWSARGQVFFTSVSVLALLVIGGTGLAYIGMGRTTYLQDAFVGVNGDAGDICLALYSVIYASWGWNALNFMVEELKNPKRNLPIAIVTSIFLVTCLYTLVNLAYFTILSQDEILMSEAVAVSFSQKTLGAFAAAMPVLIAINTAGSYNAGTLVASRICFVGARRGHLPDFLAMIQIRFLTPITSVLFQWFVVVLLTITVDLYSLINNLIFANTLFDFLAIAGMLWLRWKQPDLHRPIKTPLWIAILFLLCTLLLVVIPLIYKTTATALGLAILLCTGIPYYVIFVLWTNKPETYTRYVEKWTSLIQKIFYCVRQEGDVQF